MYKQILLRKLMKEDLKRLKKLRWDLSGRKYTKGALVKRGDKLYCSTRENQKQYSMVIHDPQIIEELKTNRYRKEMLPILEKKILLYRNFLDQDELFDPQEIEDRLLPQYKGAFAMGLFLEEDVDVEAWPEASFPSNPMEITTPCITSKGLATRSKSESIIATRLEELGLPFRYEQLVQLGNEIFFPDFIILLPDVRRLVYYEHFGMMDDPEYAKRALHKIEVYARHGIYLGVNFFASFEFKNMPFSVGDADKIISEILKLNVVDW